MIKVNGEMLEIAEGTIIPRSIWEEAILKDGDTVEVVRFVGGG